MILLPSAKHCTQLSTVTMTGIETWHLRHFEGLSSFSTGIF